MADQRPHVNSVEARGASSQGVVRYVLGASLALIIIAFAVLFFIWR